MSSRKLTFLAVIFNSCILFIAGIAILIYINSATALTSSQNNPSGSLQTNNGSLFDGIVTKDPINFLILVKDKAGSNTDVIMVANYNPQKNTIGILTVPRDTKVNIRTSIPKVNAAYAVGWLQDSRVDEKQKEINGAEFASQVISDLTGININYYVVLDISTVKGVVDLLGGVYFDVPADLKYSDPTQDLYIDLKKGYQLLDGDKSEQLLRFRHPQSSRLYTKELREFYDGSDIKRTQMQIKFLKEAISQKATLQYLPSFTSIINYAFENITTNMPLSEALKLTNGILKLSSGTLDSYRLDGTDASVNDIYYLIYNENVIDANTDERIKEAVILGYFTTTNAQFTPTEDRRYKDLKKYDSPLKNPSNDESDTVKDEAAKG